MCSSDPAGGDWGGGGYEWDEDSGRLGRVVDADGVVEADNVYDGAGRVLAQRSADGRVTRYSYLPGLVTQVADADGGAPIRGSTTRAAA